MRHPGTGISRSRPRRGASLVECALVYPMTLLLVAGMMITGLGVFRQQQVARLSRAGARWAAVHGATYQQEQSKSAPTSQDVLNAVITPKTVALDSSALTCTLAMTSSTATVTIRYTWTPEGYFSPIVLSSTSVQPISY